MDDCGSGKRLPASAPALKKLPRERVFGANSKLSGNGQVFELIGNIVEKGITGDQPLASSSAPPRPTVLPFPVARHRSHGPYWAPRVSGSSGIGDAENDGEDDDSDASNYDPVADFANPIKRKKKKALNLSNWRELVTSEDSSYPIEGNKNKSLLSISINNMSEMNMEQVSVCNGKNMSNSSSMETETYMQAESDPYNNSRKDGGASISAFGSCNDKSVKEIEVDLFSEPQSVELGHEGLECASRPILVDCKNITKNDPESQMEYQFNVEYREKTKLDGEPRIWASEIDRQRGSGSEGVEQQYESLESQIDAENLARLQSMTPAEIAEAQEELQKKLSPQLFNILKKRGRDKVENQHKFSSDLASNNIRGLHDKKDAESISVLGQEVSPLLVKSTQQISQNRLDETANQNLYASTDGLWDCWSKRVEAVRDLRFSLDGNIVRTYCLNSVDIDNNQPPNEYNADNVAQRDFLRTEGDPAAVGYTIKEALALTRSIVPGQRCLALHLIASMLSNAVQNIHRHQVGYTVTNYGSTKKDIDWEAIWAFALGPEPELVLSLRISLDDNHGSVVLACAKAIQCVLACDLNEHFFGLSEKMAIQDKHLYTAPVFRAKPDVHGGFLRGGFWKYSAKSSNILVADEDPVNGNAEGEHTIKDDSVVAGQDVAAGLVRMEILPRLCYLLETEPTPAMEECIYSITTAIARNSPTCVNAVLKCEKLIHTVLDKITFKDKIEFQASQVKAVKLLRVLAQSDKRNCSEFVKNGTFKRVIWLLLQGPSTLRDYWIILGKDQRRLFSQLMVEQLRLWKVCLKYGHCVSYFADFFPRLCLWMYPPSIEELIGRDVLQDFFPISEEVYLILGALAEKLPSWCSMENMSHAIEDICAADSETWCWKDVAPVVDIALKWMVLEPGTPLNGFFCLKNEIDSNLVSRGWAKSLLWVKTAIMHLLSIVIIKATPDSFEPGSDQRRQLLPGLVSRIGLPFIQNKFLRFTGADNMKYSEGSSFIEKLCYFRCQTDVETSVASISCLHGLLRLVVSIDRLTHLLKSGDQCVTLLGHHLPKEGSILDDGILKCSIVQWRGVLRSIMELFSSEWQIVQSIEVFGRGGPAPGVGLGWGASGGGFWSPTVVLVVADARLLVDLLELTLSSSTKDLILLEDNTFQEQIICSALALCLSARPNDVVVVEKALEIILQVPTMKYLSFCLSKFLFHGDARKLVKWEYTENELVVFSNILSSHFKNWWLAEKIKKPKVQVESNPSRLEPCKNGTSPLDTIHEDMESSMVLNDCASLTVEWAHQRLPLPMHWFLSPIATIDNKEPSDPKKASSGLVQAGLFFLLSVEAISTSLSVKNHSPFQRIPFVWKFHSLSMPLLSGMSVLEDSRSRDVFEALQRLYGQHLDDVRFKQYGKHNMNMLRFKSEIHDSYPTFIETLVEQFAAISYGDLAFGRQVAFYLHGLVETSVRLAAWNELITARVLELLPNLDDCIAKSEGYLEPPEEDEGLLEVYVKAWVSGALDRAVVRRSAAYTIALHHLSCFIFNEDRGDMLPLRRKFVKSLLRDYSRKGQHEALMLDLIHYSYPFAGQKASKNKDLILQVNLDARFQFLTEGCDGNSSLLNLVKKLKTTSENKGLDGRK